MTDLGKVSEQQERAVLKAFRDAVQSVKDQSVLNEIVALLERGDVDGVVNLLQLDQATFEPLEDAIRAAYREGGIVGAAQIGPIPLLNVADGLAAFRFNMRSLRAEEWLAAMSSRLIVEISDDQRAMVRERLTESLAQGVNPKQSALELIGRVDNRTGQRAGGFIGMTSQQARWVANAQKELVALDPNYLTRALRDKRFDKTVVSAIKSGKPLSQQKINQIVTTLQARTLQYRGQTISRTESINALRAGQFEAVVQSAEKSGATDIMKRWDATGDSRVRPDHTLLEANYKDGIPLMQAFVAPDGSRLLYPGDTSQGATGAQVINCFIPETIVAVNDLKSAIKREYSGQVIKLCAGSGVNLTVTPNHPILTQKGWIPASEVVKGDNLFYCGIGRQNSRLHPDIADGITTAEQLYNAAQSLCGVNRVCREVVNLHGEIPAKDVDVISVDSRLANTFNSALAEFCNHFTLAETDVSLAAVMFNRICDAAGIRAARRPDSGVCSSSPFSSFVRRSKRRAFDISITNGWSIHTKIIKTFVNAKSRNAKLFCDSVNRESSLKKALNTLSYPISSFKRFLLGNISFSFIDLIARHRGDSKVFKTVNDASVRNSEFLGDMGNWPIRHSRNNWEKFLSLFFPCSDFWPSSVNPHIDKSFFDNPVGETCSIADKSNGLARLVKGFNLVEVDFIDHYHYDGPVYNYETKSGLIVAGNTITHNCRCAPVYRIDYIKRLAKIEGFA